MHLPTPDQWREFQDGVTPALRVSPETCTSYHQIATADRPRSLIAGSFNPVHKGHLEMATQASQILGVPVEFELSIANVDKPDLNQDEVLRRLRQFAAAKIDLPFATSLWLTRAPKFAQKSELFSGVRFVVGMDTIRRVADLKYHGENVATWRQAVQAIADRGCGFLVFGRLATGGFETLSDGQLPEPLHSLCQGVPEQQFREDVSSTQLRSKDST